MYLRKSLRVTWNICSSTSCRQKHTQPWAPIVFLQSSLEHHPLCAPEPDSAACPECTHGWSCPLNATPRIGFPGVLSVPIREENDIKTGTQHLIKTRYFLSAHPENSDIYVFFHNRHWVTFPDLCKYLLENTSGIDLVMVLTMALSTSPVENNRV